MADQQKLVCFPGLWYLMGIQYILLYMQVLAVEGATSVCI